MIESKYASVVKEKNRILFWNVPGGIKLSPVYQKHDKQPILTPG